MRNVLIPGLLVAALVTAGCGSAAGGPQPPAPPATSVVPTSPASPTPSPAVPLLEEGPGTFRVAPGGTGRVGTGGQLLRYRVEVEDDIQLDPAGFAATADQILADAQGWTAGGQWSFQRVDGGQADFLLRLATPATVDEICGIYWVDTEGEYSCRAGDFVMINLRRWLYAVPHFDGDLETYRRYVINHEVGHRLGHGHVSCPQQGGLAPVMMQQTIALEGCLANGWPYVEGEFLTGPPRA